MAEVIVGYVVQGARSGDLGWQTTKRHFLVSAGPSGDPILESLVCNMKANVT